MKPDKLMVVAHPDDESLFGGAQLVLFRGRKVVCVTNGDNPIRRKEFEIVMKKTGSDYEIWDYPDEQYTPLDENRLRSDLERIVSEQKWDKIVTHSRMGEYGHMHHIQVHCLLKILTPDLWVFNFDSNQHLPEDVWSKKCDLVYTYVSQKYCCAEHLLYVHNERLTQEFISLL